MSTSDPYKDFTERLKAGDVGTVIHVHSEGKAFEVEFLTLHGETAAIATVDGSSICPVTQRDMTHARLIEQPAQLTVCVFIENRCASFVSWTTAYLRA